LFEFCGFWVAAFVIYVEGVFCFNKLKMSEVTCNIFIKYIVYCLLAVFVNEFMKQVFHIDEVMYNSLGEKIVKLQMLDWFQFNSSWYWSSYFLVPIYVFIKLGMVSTVLFVGVSLFNKKIGFKQLYDSVLNAEFFFLLVPLCKIIWFFFFQKVHNIMDVQLYYPFSGLNFISYQGLRNSLIYPLQLLNLFESSYVLFLGFQIGNLTNTDFDRGISIVCSSYLPVLLLWVFMCS
jgi:hypothetical protein